MEQISRGNRIRKTEWLEVFRGFRGFAARPLYSWTRSPAMMPRDVDPAVTHADDMDLLTSHLGVFGEKASGASAPG